MDKTHVIRENRTFRQAYRKGRSFTGRSLVTYVLPARGKNYAVGITTSKKIGCAVERNRARRVIRAAFRQLEPGVKSGQIVFVARRKTCFVKSTRVLEEMREHLKKAGVLE